MIKLVKFLNSWAQGIILAVIVATIIEIILPKGNNKKYVKTIIGIYILFVIVYPLISKITNNKIDIESVIASTTSTMNKYEIDNNISLETNEYIEEVYKHTLEEDVTSRLKEKGYKINSLNLYLELADEDRYGEIISIVMQISKINTSNKKTGNTENEINTVKEVKISVSNSNKAQEEKKEEIEKEELDSLKEYLNNVYSVEKERIHINE